MRGRRRQDRFVVYLQLPMSSNPARREVYAMHHYVIKFVSDLRQVGVSFFLASSTHKTDRYKITEILLKMALNTIALTRIKFKISITNKLTYRKSHNVFARYNIEHKILSET